MTTTKTPRIFEIKTIWSTPVPAEALAAPTREVADALPFKKWFDENEEVAAKGEAPASLFVPLWFFAERADDASKVDGPYVKSKLREQFNKWRDSTKVVTTKEQRAASTPKPRMNKDGTPATDKAGKPIVMNIPGKVVIPEVSTNEKRGKFVLYALERNGKEKDVKEITGGDPGVQFWFTVAKAS